LKIKSKEIPTAKQLLDRYQKIVQRQAVDQAISTYPELIKLSLIKFHNKGAVLTGKNIGQEYFQKFRDEQINFILRRSARRKKDGDYSDSEKD